MGWTFFRYYGSSTRYDSGFTGARLGKSASATVALQMPAGYTPGRDAWNELTLAERRFIKAHLAAAISFAIARQDALGETARNFIPEARLDGRMGNAFQHAFWSALMTSAQGAALAEEFGNAHEARPTTGPVQETLRDMDYYNNAVGRQVALENAGATKDQLSSKVMDAYLAGRLRIVCPPTCP